jgi:hypothetical protein
MNEPTLSGPCAGYEFEIVELHEGALGPIDAARVRSHVEGCARCRDWQAQYAALDATLARTLPRPQLSADFAVTLKKRLEGIASPTTRRDLRAAAEREHDWIVRDLRRAARRRAIMGSAAGAAIAGTAVALAYTLGPQALALLRAAQITIGPSALGTLGGAAMFGALVWSAMRGMLPGVRLRR